MRGGRGAPQTRPDQHDEDRDLRVRVDVFRTPVTLRKKSPVSSGNESRVGDAWGSVFG